MRAHHIGRSLCAAALTLTSLSTVALADRAPHYGEEIALRGYHGTYLVAESDGTANANRATVGSWERFGLFDAFARQPDRPLRYGDVIGLRGVHGLWFVGEPDGRLNADRAEQRGWERFIVMNPGGGGGEVPCGGLIGLRSQAFGQYVAAEPDGAANANRTDLGPWEAWQLECHSAPRPAGVQTLEIAGGGGLVLEFDGARPIDNGGGLDLSGALVLDFQGIRTSLFDAEVRATLDGEGRIETLFGRARVAPDPTGALDIARFDDLIVGEIGLTYGRDLGHLGAPLQPDTRYLFVNLEAGPSIDIGPAGFAVRGGATLVLDPSDPFIFAEGRIEGLSELTVVESAAVGISAHGRIPLQATETWGLDGIPTGMQGHLYMSGRVAIPKTPLIVEGELLVDADVNDDGYTLFDGSPEAGLLFNGSADVDLAFGPLPGVTLPVGSASAGGTIMGDDVAVWYSGVSGLDVSDLLPDLPFLMHGQRMTAGYLSTNIEDSFVVLGGDVQLGDWSLIDGSLYIDLTGMQIDASLNLHLARVDMQGHVGESGFGLTGTASFDHELRAPKEIFEWIDVPVNYTANAAVCGYDTITDGAVCGWQTVTDVGRCGVSYVTDGAACGWDYITDGATCGWETVWGWFCGLFGPWCSRDEPLSCNVARSCDVAATCDVESTCDVAASCTRIESQQRVHIEPDFDFGRVGGQVTVDVDNGTVTASADAFYCDVGGVCWAVDTGDLRVSPNDIELCIDVPELGHTCLRL